MILIVKFFFYILNNCYLHYSTVKQENFHRGARDLKIYVECILLESHERKTA